MARVIMALFMLNLSIMIVLPSYGEELWPDDIRMIKERGELIVAQYQGIEPAFFFYDDSKEFPDQTSYLYEGRRLVGCDIALATHIADELGVKLRFDRTAMNYDAVCRYVSQGRADLGVSMLSVSPKRAQYVRFSSPYVAARIGVLMNRLHMVGIKSADPFLGFCHRKRTKIGILGGCSYVDIVKELCPPASLVYYDDFSTMLKGVLEGRVHGLLDDEFQILSALHGDPELAVRLDFALAPEYQDRIAIAVSPQCPNLLAFVNVVLDSSRVKSRLANMLQLFTTGLK